LCKIEYHEPIQYLHTHAEFYENTNVVITICKSLCYIFVRLCKMNVMDEQRLKKKYKERSSEEEFLDKREGGKESKCTRSCRLKTHMTLLVIS